MPVVYKNVIALYDDILAVPGRTRLPTGMRSVVKNFRLPCALEDPVAERVKAGPYANLSEYIVGLIRFDVMTNKKHVVTAEIAKLSRAQIDEIDDEIATIFKKGESLGGSWFEARLQAAVEASGKPEQERHKIVNALLRNISGR